MNTAPHRRTFLRATGAAALPASSYARIPGANDRVGVGFVGYGLMAKKHVATFRAAEGCDVVAMSEVHRGRLEEAVAAAGGKAAAYPDFRKLLEDKAVNAVVTATPDHWHALVTMLACAAGKDVYVEKPLTLFVREGEWMQSVAAKHKSVGRSAHSKRPGKHYQRRELVQKGHIGKVVSVRMPAVRNITPGFGSPLTTEPPPELDYDRWLGPAPARSTTCIAVSTTSAGSGTTPAGRMTNLGASSTWPSGSSVSTNRARSTSVGVDTLTDNGETPTPRTRSSIAVLGRLLVHDARSRDGPANEQRRRIPRHERHARHHAVGSP